MQVNKVCRDWYFVHYQIVNTLFRDLTYSDRKNKASRSVPIDEDNEERMIMEFNNSYTFTKTVGVASRIY